MHLARAVFFLFILALPWSLHAQATPLGLGQDDISRLEAGGSFNYFHANAPPGQCGCFSLYGGSGSLVYNITPVWSIVADVTYAHANNVNGTKQNITIINYLFGPRYTRRTSSRWVPYGEILLGGAKEDVNFQFVINKNAFGLLAGGGVSTKIHRKLSMTVGQIDYVYTQIPNATNNRQNNLRLSTGLIYSFGAH